MVERIWQWIRPLMLAVVSATAAAPAQAQDAHTPTRVWAGAGFAAAASRNVEAGLGLLLELSAQRGHHHGSLRTLLVLDFGGFPDSGGGDSIVEAGLTYGRTRTHSYGHASIATGLSLLSFDACPGDFSRVCRSIGVPVVAEAAVSARVIGIGLQAFGNVNPKAPYAGLAIFLQLGWLP